MLPVLRSIDVLLNRFDQLSQRHSGLSSNFEAAVIDVANPLRDIARNADEQRQTLENLSSISNETFDHGMPIDCSEVFNRRVTKNRCGNRPPIYSSNDSVLCPNRIPSSSSWVTSDSTPVSEFISTKSQKFSKPVSNSAPTFRVNFDERTRSNDRYNTRGKSRIPPPPLPVPKRIHRPVITTFTVETANRLSKPKTYYPPSQRHTFLKRSPSRSKLPSPPRKDTSASSCSSMLTSTTLSQAKRTSPIGIKEQFKKVKIDSKESNESSKKINTSNYPRPTIDYAPPPTIHIGFPTRNEIQSSRVIVFPPNLNQTQKKSNSSPLTLNKKALIMSQNRMMHLMT